MWKLRSEDRPPCRWREHTFLPKQYLVMCDPIATGNTVVLLKECPKCGRLIAEPLIDEPHTTR